MPQRGTAARSVARRKDLSTGTDDGNAARVTTATMGVAQALQDADASRSQFKTEEQKAKNRKAELKNGRLAMIGIISFLVSHNLPGSVPALTSAF